MALYRIAVVGKYNSTDEFRNIFTVSDGLVPQTNLPDNADIVTWLNTMWTTSLLSSLSTRMTLQKFIIEQPVNGHWSYWDEYPYSKAGTATEEMLPQQMAPVIIGVTRSRRRGKKFLAGMTEADNNAGVVSAAFQTKMNTFGAAWIQPFTSGGVTWQVGVCKPDGSDFLYFTTYHIDTVLGTQRRRKQGVGA